MELVDMPDLGSGAEKHKSSSLLWGTLTIKNKIMVYKKLYSGIEVDLNEYIKEYMNLNDGVESIRAINCLRGIIMNRHYC